MNDYAIGGYIEPSYLATLHTNVPQPIPKDFDKQVQLCLKVLKNRGRRAKAGLIEDACLIGEEGPELAVFPDGSMLSFPIIYNDIKLKKESQKIINKPCIYMNTQEEIHLAAFCSLSYDYILSNADYLKKNIHHLRKNEQLNLNDEEWKYIEILFRMI